MTVEEYINNASEDKKLILKELRATITKNLPKGFEETIVYNMIGYVVPLKTYPKGYHCKPGSPLPFISIAAQKNFVAMYHMGLYADKKLLDWFIKEYTNNISKKPDIGKSCIRFKNKETVPMKLIGELSKKISVKEWIKKYEEAFKK